MKTNVDFLRWSTSLLIGLSLLFSCTEENPEPEPQPAAKVTLDHPEDLDIQIGQEGAEKVVSFQSNGPWQADVSAAGEGWVAISAKSGGKGTNEITVKVETNDTYESRAAEITLVVERGITPAGFSKSQEPTGSVVIQVHQAGVAEKLDLVCRMGDAPTGFLEKEEDGTPHFHFNSVKQSFEVEVTANNRYRVEILKDDLAPENLPPHASNESYQWFEWQPATEEEMKQEVSVHRFYMDYNGGNGESYEAIERHVTLHFISEYGSVEKVVKVTQTPATKIEIQADFKMDAKGGKVEIPFRNNADQPEDYRIELPVDVNWIRWIKPSVKTKAAMVEVVAHLELDENNTQQDREAVLSLYVGEGDPVKFRIFQKCLPFLQLGTEEIKKSFDGKGGELWFQVTSNEEYSIDLGAADWIVPVEESGVAQLEEEKGIVRTRTWKYIVQKNETPDKRTAVIKVVHAEFGTSFEILQYPDVDPNQVLELPGASPYQVNVPWEGGEVRIPIKYCLPIFSTIHQSWVKMTANPTNPDFKQAAQETAIEPVAITNPTMEEGELVFQVEENKLAQKRECKIDLYNDGTYYWNTGVPHWEIHLHQAEWVDNRRLQLKEAMQKLYDDLNGPNWSRQNGWKEATGNWREYDGVTYQVINGKIDRFKIYISDTQLKGKLDIQHFPDVTAIELYGDISSVRLSDAPHLVQLSIHTDGHNLKIEDFNLQNCPELNQIIVNGKLLEGHFKAEGCPKLTDITFRHTLLQSMDFTQWPALQSASVSESPEFASINVQGLKNLVSLTCADSKVTSLDCSNLSELKYLYGGNNSLLTSLKVNGCPDLFTLRIAANSSLRQIDLSENPKLYDLSIDRAGLEVLDLSHCQVRYIKSGAIPATIYMPHLKKLDVHGTSITAIDLSMGDDNNPVSIEVDAHDCKNLTDVLMEADQVNFNAAGCSTLQTLDLTGYYSRKNRYTSGLNVTGCSSLKILALNGVGSHSFDDFTIQAAQLPALENLSVSRLTAGYLQLNAFKQLKQVSMSECKMDSIDCSGMKTLENFNMTAKEPDQSQAYQADFSDCPELREVYLTHSKLQGIRTKGCDQLYRLGVLNNALKSLGTNSLPSLSSLSCENNFLEVFDPELYPSLQSISCENNRLNQEVTKAFWARIKSYSKLEWKYRYYQEYDEVTDKMVDKTETHPYGWWFPGEPASRTHGAPKGW